ncbi:ferroxidase fet3 [Coemansia sp. RSA 986]|nr:ferroxidase fet3 [Coemansia sp. RSA 986]
MACAVTIHLWLVITRRKLTLARRNERWYYIIPLSLAFSLSAGLACIPNSAFGMKNRCTEAVVPSHDYLVIRWCLYYGWFIIASVISFLCMFSVLRSARRLTHMTHMHGHSYQSSTEEYRDAVNARANSKRLRSLAVRYWVVDQEEWTVEWVDYNMDNLFTRKAIGINGQWPIPAVVGDFGDTLVVHVTNKLEEATSLHFHGLFQNGTNYYDGAVMVTECGVPPGGSFTYRVELKQAGTYWIHSHSKSQTADGMRMPLVIRDPHEHYQYDDEIIMPLQDWFQEPAPVLMKQFNDPDPHIRFRPIIPYAVIGGSCANSKRLNFVAGKTYRIRLANIGSSFDFHFSIDAHPLRVIEVDGVMVREHLTHGVTVSPGQRVSVLVTALDSSESNYLFHSDMYTDLLEMPKYNPLNFTGTIEYSSVAKTRHVRGSTWTCVLDLDLEPLDREPIMEPDTRVTLNAYSGIFSDQSFRHSFNNISYLAPEVPTVLTALTTGDMAMDPEIYGRRSNTHVLKHLDVVEVQINNYDYYSHPFHLHGHVFQIIETGSIREGKIHSKSALDIPVKRDTVVVRGGSYAIVRFRADNPGVWLFHCHIDFHIMLGLQMTFVEAPDKLQQQMKAGLPDMHRENCIAQGIKTTGNAAGRKGLDMGKINAELPTPYPDQFESYYPPSGWELISYIIHGNKDNVESIASPSHSSS